MAKTTSNALGNLGALSSGNNKPNMSYVANADQTLPGKVAISIPIDQLYAAPSKWNFYEPHTSDEKSEMLDSIRQNGLEMPITLWKIDKDSVQEFYEGHTEIYEFGGAHYMILSGHNRTDDFRSLYEATGEEKYKTIPAFIYKEKELEPYQAHNLIVDLNHLGRNKSIRAKTLAIMHKYGQNPDATDGEIAESLGLSVKTVRRYKKLGKMNEGLRERVYTEQIGLVQALKLADYRPEIQTFLEETFGNELTNKMISQFKPSYERRNFEELFTKPEEEMVQVGFKVPIALEKEFKKRCAKILKELQSSENIDIG